MLAHVPASFAKTMYELEMPKGIKATFEDHMIESDSVICFAADAQIGTHDKPIFKEFRRSVFVFDRTMWFL